ncbi:hypothetical protein AYJ57_21495 (plasmid) [Salipiger sp. CCB-MM3]|uniref:metallophosphoesterase family protein n=1 Tax=Salipiger sp. CCB-MM3 TaxID=1792508 RepID=UPI00080AC2D2|nr:metallophosphoesterase [Salipiger sp. CCB-MM3]ANT63051.1 hypothetical protein AYJ57_21495 [Salipiger sp. CCB-MM3]
MKNDDQNILFYGDPHGNYAPLISACLAERPDTVLIAGDMTGPKDGPDRIVPIREAIAPLLRDGVEVIWTHGNHDTDSEEIFDATFGSYPERHLHGDVRTLKGSSLRVGALGGVFRGAIWFPEMDYEDAARYDSPEHFMSETDTRWRGDLPLRHWSSIFPSDAERIRNLGADILLTDEAPSNMTKFGFMALDQLADDMGAKMIVHGHHHTASRGRLMNGLHVCGLAKAEPFRFRLPRQQVCPGASRDGADTRATEQSGGLVGLSARGNAHHASL